MRPQRSYAEPPPHLCVVLARLCLSKNRSGTGDDDILFYLATRCLCEIKAKETRLFQPIVWLAKTEENTRLDQSHSTVSYVVKD